MILASIPRGQPRCVKCKGYLIYDILHDEVECDRRSLRGIVDDMRTRIRGAAPVDGELRHVVTTDGVHTRGVMKRSVR